MKKFLVTIKEVHTATKEVEAESEEQAREIVEEMLETSGVTTDYSYTMDSFDWIVREVGQDEREEKYLDELLEKFKQS